MPIITTGLLLKCRNALRSGTTNALVDATSFIHHDYERDFYAWEALDILRKFFFVGLITVLFPVGSAAQIFAALVALTFLTSSSSVEEPALEVQSPSTVAPSNKKTGTCPWGASRRG